MKRILICLISLLFCGVKANAVEIVYPKSNNVTINSQFYVKQQNGQLITLKGSPVVFEVKNIEKNFALDSFVYILKLLEV